MARIGIDADGTGWDLISSWLELWAATSGRRHTMDEIVVYNPHKVLGPDGKEMSPEDAERFYALLESAGLFFGLKPFPGFLDGAEALNSDGHEIHLVSAPAGPVSASEKLHAFKRDLPWLSRKRVTLTFQKHLMDLDYLIDDAPENVEAMRRSRPGTVLVGLEMPWNRGERHLWDFLAKDWSEIVAFIREREAANRARKQA